MHQSALSILVLLLFDLFRIKWQCIGYSKMDGSTRSRSKNDECRRYIYVDIGLIQGSAPNSTVVRSNENNQQKDKHNRKSDALKDIMYADDLVVVMVVTIYSNCV